MSSPPAWLPLITSCDGDWDEVVERLYHIFDMDFNKGVPRLNGIPVWWDRRILPGDRFEEAFWHLITRDDRPTGTRLLDTRRAERLCWCCPIIQNSRDPAVLIWDYLEQHGKVRTYLWLEAWDYVIVLEKQQKRVGPVYYLVTAFHLDGESRRRNLRRKYNQRVS